MATDYIAGGHSFFREETGSMKDCKLVMTARDGRVDVQAEHMSLVELTELCGILQVLAGQNAMEWGLGLDEVKDNLLDIYLAAMQQLERRTETE